MSKIKGSEVTIGQSIKGNILGGVHVVAKIETSVTNLRVAANTIELLNEDGELIWIGRTYAKVTIPA